ncbi:MAG: cupin domain-containing protein [Planctomycetota bacterium]|nr:MAG: cupin domain-containing protein [Planctomycetota bacterium]
MNTPNFIDWDKILSYEMAPGVRIRTPYGQNIMLSMLEMDEGAEVPIHQHPHEQAGILLEGKMNLAIGSETRVVEPGMSYIIPPDTPHGASPIGGSIRTLDIFSPIRQDYADKQDQT